jgi:hypothetical protein
MQQEELLAGVEPGWHQEFLRFIETGDASEEFLTYMDQDPACQAAVEAAFSEQAAAFESLSRDLRTAVPDAALAKARSSVLSEHMAQALERTLALPPSERTKVVERTVSTLVREVPPRRRQELKEIVSDLAAAV